MPQLKPDAALILVDIQQGFNLDDYWGKRNNPDAEDHMERILNTWRETNRPIFHIKHNSVMPNSPLNPKHEGNAFKPPFEPQGDDPVLGKTVNSAFIGTDLEQRLRDAGIEQVVIIGLTTNHCVSTTTRMSGNLGFETYLVSDATATHERAGYNGQHYTAQQIHDMELSSLHNEFATVVTTDEIITMATA